MRFFLFSACIIICFTGCKQRNTTERTVFMYNESSGITSLDPAYARNQANIWATNQLFNGLVQLNDKLEVEPCIASSWTVTEDGKKYVFRLRKDVFFHDDSLFPLAQGRQVTAGDFVYSFNRIVDTRVASPGIWVFNNVKKEGETYAFKATDDTTFIIELKESFPPFLSLLTMQYCSVVPKEIVENPAVEFRKHPVGTGPFQFKFWKEGAKLVMVKNTQYFEREGSDRLPYLDAVSVSFIVDKQSVFLEFIKGNLDFMSGLDASYKDELLTKQGSLNPKYRGKFRLITQPYLNTEYLGFMVDPAFNIQKNNPLLKKEVRQAINYSFDRIKMMKYLRNNIGYPGIYGFIPPGLPSFDSTEVKGYNYQPEKARRLLAQAGYPNGNGLPEILLSTNATYLDLATYIQQQLNEMGFRVKIDVHPPASMREMVAQGKLSFFRGSWIADYPDAENYLSLFYSPNFTPVGPNYTHYSNKTYDELYQKAIEETDKLQRYRYYRQMDQLVIEEAPVVVLYYDQVLRFTQVNIEGLGSNAMNLLTLKKVKKSSTP